MKKISFTLVLAFLGVFISNAQEYNTTRMDGVGSNTAEPSLGMVKSTLKRGVEGPIEIQRNLKSTRGSVFSETFSSGSLPAGWSNVDNNGGGKWLFNNPKARTINTTTGKTGIAIFDSDYLGGDGKAENADLITPAIDCSALTVVALSFEHYFYAGFNGAAKLFVSGDNGATWTLLQAWSATATANAALAKYDISTVAAGKSQVKIKWSWTGDYSWYWAIDDISVIEPSAHDLSVKTINAPTTVFTDSIVSPSVTILNSGISTESNYSVLLTDGGAYLETVSVTNPIDPEASYNVVFPSWTPATGSHTLTATVTLTGDMDAQNNSKSLIVNAVPAKHDLSVDAIIVPPTVFCDSLITPVVRIKNAGNYKESVYAVSLSNGAGKSQTIDVSTAVAIGMSSDIPFPDWKLGDGTYTLTATVTLPNDAIAGNNVKTTSIQSLPAIHDLGIIGTSIPSSVLSDSVVKPLVYVNNFGNYTETAFSVLLTDGGAYSETVNITSALNSGNYYTVTFPDWIPTTGNHTMTATVTFAGDMLGRNNKISSTIKASPALHNLAVNYIGVSTVLLSDSLVTPAVVISNYGNYKESAYSVSLTDGGSYNQNVDVTTPVNTGENYSVTFPDWTPATGNYKLVATVTLVGDGAESDNKDTLDVVVAPAKHDLAATSIIVPSVIYSDSTIMPAVIVRNSGNYKESAYSVSLTDGGAYTQTVDVTAAIDAGFSKNITFPSWIPTTGDHTLIATVTLTGDAVASNDKDTLAVTARAAVHDLAIKSVINAVESGTTVSPFVILKNIGDYKESAYSVTLSDGGSYSQTVNETSAIAIGSTYKVVFPEWTPADGVHTLTATLTMAGDMNAANNTLAQACKVIDPIVAYASTFDGGSVNGTLNVPFDKFTVIGRSAYQIQSLAWKDSLLYAITSDGRFGNINIADGSFKQIGLTGITCNHYTSLLCDPTTGKMYTTTLTGGYPNFVIGLYSIDHTTGLGTLVANSSHSGTAAQFAFDKDGKLYAIEHRQGKNGLLYTMDKATAAMTSIGDVGGVVSANFQPMVWDFNEGVMYFQASGAMQGTYLINLSTGEATLVGVPCPKQILTMALPVWNSNLLDLTVNGVTVPGFSSLKYHYNVVLPSGTTAIPVIDGKMVYSKATKVVTAAAALPGSSTVVITAPDGTSKTYTITFTVPENTNATLSNLQVKGVTVANFNPATYTYNVQLPSASKSVPMVTATAFDANATMVINAAAALPGATTVEVTAQDGVTKLTYTVNFTVAAMTDAALTDLKVGGVTLAGFNPDTYSYNVELPYGTTIVPAVTATARDSKAVKTITNAPVLPGGTNVVVTANDGITQLTYTINFTIGIQTFTVNFSVVNANGTLAATVDAAAIASPALVKIGKDVVFTATPAANYTVKEWKLNDAVVAGNATNTYTLSGLSANATVTVEFRSTVGVSEIDQNGVNIYPNPSNGVVNIEMNTPISKVTVVDVKGTVVIESVLNNNTGTLNTSTLANGIYFLRIVTTSGVITKQIQVVK
jgi:hypothetical protein